MAQNHGLSYVSCFVGWSENLTGSCKRSRNEDAKIGIGFVSSLLSDKINKIFSPNSPGFINVNQTVNERWENICFYHAHYIHYSILLHAWLQYTCFWYNFFYIFQDIITDLNAEGEPLPIRPINEDWIGHKVSPLVTVSISRALL